MAFPVLKDLPRRIGFHHLKSSNTFIQCAMERLLDEDKEWGLEHDPFSDPEEKRVLFTALDSFRYVHPSLVFDLFKYFKIFLLVGS